MTALLEVAVLHASDAARAEAGGADRVALGTVLEHGLSPEPAVVEQVRAATSLPVRVVLRLRDGYSTDGGEAVRLKGLLSAYRSAGADGVVAGFLNGHTDLDVGVLTELFGESDVVWTLSRAVDACISADRAWREARQLPGLDQVHTAGSPRGVTAGLDDLVARVEADAFARSVVMAGGELLPEHVPWLARAGVRAFHISAAARPLGSVKAYVDSDLVGTWRTLVDDAVRRAGSR